MTIRCDLQTVPFALFLCALSALAPRALAQTPAQAQTQGQAQPLSAAADWRVLNATDVDATVDGKPLNTGDTFPGGRLVATGTKGFVKILARTGAIVILKPGSRAKLDLPSPDTTPSLLEGAARWIFRRQPTETSAVAAGKGKPSSDEGKPRFRFATANAVMGIRGTDLYVSYAPLLGETEVICFDGAFDFVNQKNFADRRRVATGQWGGLGGRFGNTIAPVLTLAQNVVDVFRNGVTVPTTLAQPTKVDPLFHGEAVP